MLAVLFGWPDGCDLRMLQKRLALKPSVSPVPMPSAHRKAHCPCRERTGCGATAGGLCLIQENSPAKGKVLPPLMMLTISVGTPMTRPNALAA